LPVDDDLAGGLEAKPHFVALDADHGQDDIVADVDPLADPA
jgi:hypothetical protein